MFELPPRRVAIMGILNVTPDSFSDGGQFDTFDRAVSHAEHMMEQGADLIDVGGESTRPGSEPVSLTNELERVVPVVAELVKRGIPVSVDTSKPEVARQGLLQGAQVINDVTGLRDPAMIEVCAEADAFVCIMHMQGSPKSMQAHPVYGDVVRDVHEYLVHAASLAESAGLERSRIWIDPGIGFGKSHAHNLELLRRLQELTSGPYPVLIGVSRKSFLGRILHSESNPGPVEDRANATLAAEVFAMTKGVRIVRTHEVRRARDAAKTMAAILSTGT